MVQTVHALLQVTAVLALVGCGASGPRLGPRPPGDPIATVDAAALEARGRALLAAGDAIRAEQYLAAAIARGAPADRVVPELVALCLASSRHRAALSYAVPHLRRHPNDWALMHLVAMLYLVVGEPDAAERHAAQAVLLAPDQPDLAFVHALALQRLGRDKAARRAFGRYIELARNGPYAAEARQALRSGKDAR
jgi:tetratricopeptide (TPR) repeat protein